MNEIHPVDEFAFDLAQENVLNMFPNLTMLSILLTSLIKDSKPFPKTSSVFKEEYDYVVVGGGTAGSVIASRLSQKHCVTVLLLEAGDTPLIVSEVPAITRFTYGSRIDWLYKTTPQKYGAHGQIENRVYWNSGKALGGSSVLNAMLYARGNKKNYDDWQAAGAKGWSYEDVLPYFKKLEDNRNIKELDKDYHSVGGPLTVEKPNYNPKLKDSILTALKNLGFKLTDVNGKRQTGIYDLEGTLRNGQRCSTAKAYLVPAEDRPNLDILKNAFVRKILIEDSRAYGVEFDYRGKRRSVRAKQEVIISNGSIRTPQLLMLSGIGPREHLEKFNISVVKDLPVGKNLQDHCTTYLTYLVNDSIPLPLKLSSPVTWADYLAFRSGPFVSPNQVFLMAFLSGLNTTENTTDFPRHELYFADYSIIDAKLNYNLKPEVYKKGYHPYAGRPMYTCIVSLLQPKSRGEITLNSLDPHESPLINPNYYKEESDLRDVVEGMKICQAVAKSKGMQKSGTTLFPPSVDGCEKYKDDEDQYLECFAKYIITTIWHPVGTARMGDPKDPQSVVDPQLRVIGIKGLRVINAAVMPIIPSANTNVPTMMVAEKAYDMMKDDVQCDNENNL